MRWAANHILRWAVNDAIRRVGHVQPLDVNLDPAASDEVTALWVDGVCWQVQLVTWALHRPPWWRRHDRREWRRQREELDAAGERLRRRARAVERRDRTDDKKTDGNGRAA